MIVALFREQCTSTQQKKKKKDVSLLKQKKNSRKKEFFEQILLPQKDKNGARVDKRTPLIANNNGN